MIIDYPNLTEMLSTDGVYPDRPNGWFLKVLDTGETFHRISGEWEPWGLGLSFAPPTKSGQVQTDNNGEASIVFGTPFYDDSYTVALTCSDEGVPVSAYVVSKIADGFSIITCDPKKHEDRVRDVFVSWLATRNFND
jgi:hypothetical protein